LPADKVYLFAAASAICRSHSRAESAITSLVWGRERVS
jgi:hypothetical protein